MIWSSWITFEDYDFTNFEKKTSQISLWSCFAEATKYATWNFPKMQIKVEKSQKATKFCEIFISLLSYVVQVKSKVKISQNFVAFSEYMNFKEAAFGYVIAEQNCIYPLFSGHNTICVVTALLVS